MNDQIKTEQPNEAHISPSELNAGLGIPTREQLIWALCEVMDGMSWYDLKADTGLSQGECEKLLEIRNSVHQQWVDSGMKMPKVESELNAGLDEIVKLRDALKSYAACGDGCTCGDGWSHDIANAALTPNDGAQRRVSQQADRLRRIEVKNEQAPLDVDA